MNQDHAKTRDITIKELLRQSSSAEQKRLVTNYIRKQVCQTLGIEESTLDDDSIIWDVDSMLLIRMVNIISSGLDIEIDPAELVALFSQFKISNLARYCNQKFTEKKTGAEVC